VESVDNIRIVTEDATPSQCTIIINVTLVGGVELTVDYQPFVGPGG